MHHDQAPYRALCETILGYDGNTLYDDLLAPWLDDAASEKLWLSALAPKLANLPSELPHEDLWRLYALTRVLDLLIRFGLEPMADLRAIKAADYSRFAETLGLNVETLQQYHPFWYEVADIDVAEDPNAAPNLIETLWPAVTLGPLLITRGGAKVRAGRNVIDPDVALTSTLYWTYTRAARPTCDLSSGWGSNSQWRTAHRLDYATETEFHFNKGGTGDLLDDTPLQDALDLLRNRCSLTPPASNGPDYEYELTLTEPTNSEAL